MQAEMLSCILHVRAGLKRANCCCHNFQIKPEMVADVGTVKIYDRKIVQVEENENSTDNDVQEVFDILNDVEKMNYV